MKLDIRAVKVLMAQQGIDTQTELAEIIGLSNNAVSELLLGKRVPSLDTIGALCKALNCTPNDILSYDVPKVMALVGVAG
jgi:DNA-binding Xre family transcriptional regulator